jgi:hypothetical protein
MLQRRPTLSAQQAPRLRAQHIRGRIGTPPDHEWDERDGHAVIARVAT